jgi:hypothetical protein
MTPGAPGAYGAAAPMPGASAMYEGAGAGALSEKFQQVIQRNEISGFMAKKLQQLQAYVSCFFGAHLMLF